MMNINFEDDYLPVIEFDKKHDVSNKALETIKKVMLAQDEIGIKKYKKPLHHTYNYDWLQMFLEEMADGLKYIQNEIDRKRDLIEMLEMALKYKNWALVETALNVLKTEGTGK